MYLHIIPVILNEADSSTTTDLDVTVSYSDSESNNQSDGNSGSSFVLFGDESNSEMSSVNSGSLFRQDDFTTSESKTNTEQSYENRQNNIQHHVINKNKSNMDTTEKSHRNHQFWHDMKLLLENVFNFQLIFLTFISCTLFK